MKFKLGDVVKVIDPSGHPRGCKKGDIGTVVRLWNNGDYGIDVKIQGTGNVVGMFEYRFVSAEKIIKVYGIVNFMKGINVKV